MSNPRERSKRVIAERFFAGETIGELMRDYEECEAFVLEAVREHRLSDNEEAVIEAARALFRGYTVEDSSADAWRCDDVLDHRLHDLFLKVEALDKAEADDE